MKVKNVRKIKIEYYLNVNQLTQRMLRKQGKYEIHTDE